MVNVPVASASVFNGMCVAAIDVLVNVVVVIVVIAVVVIVVVAAIAAVTVVVDTNTGYL
jgi:hypothetical protein